MEKHVRLRKKAIHLRKQGESLTEICKTLDKSKSTVWYWIEHIKIDRTPMKLHDRFPDEHFADTVASARSLTEVCCLLGISQCNHFAVKRRIAKSRIDTSHFKWPMTDAVRIVREVSGRPPTPLEDILVQNSTYSCNNRLKIRLLAASYFESKCCTCGRDTWLCQSIPIQLHHKNEIKTDNRIENITILCASCHALAHGWNVRRIVRGRPLKEILVINCTYTNPTRIRDKLITAGYFEAKCHECDLQLWQGEPIPLHLHHKNGVRSDYRLENLDILCPNCHGLTDHWCGRFA